MTIDNWLTNTTDQFVKAGVPSARLDAELLLCHLLGVERSWLIAHGDELLSRAALTSTKGVHPGGIKTYGDKLVFGRLKRQPIAYLLGYKEFYGRTFIVNKRVLIPRPETEALIDLAKKHGISGQILDVGTGSGAIGLTLLAELKNVSVTLSDLSEDALDVATKNAKKLKLKPDSIVHSDLLDKWQTADTQFGCIVANLPYVDRSCERSPETNQEPAMALFAQDGGLELIKLLIDQAKDQVTIGGHLLLESDPEQQNAIVKYAYESFRQRDRLGYGLLLERV